MFFSMQAGIYLHYRSALGFMYLAMARDTIIQIKFVQKLLSLFSSNMRFNLPLFLKQGRPSIKETMLQPRVTSTEKSKSC